MHTEGQALGEGYTFEKKKKVDERKKVSRKGRYGLSSFLCLEPVQAGAVTQTVNSILPFIHGGLSESDLQGNAKHGQRGRGGSE